MISWRIKEVFVSQCKFEKKMKQVSMLFLCRCSDKRQDFANAAPLYQPDQALCEVFFSFEPNINPKVTYENV